MGLGMHTSEEVIIDADTGRLVTDGTWEYKIPAASCIPQQLNVTFLKARPAASFTISVNGRPWCCCWQCGGAAVSPSARLVVHASRLMQGAASFPSTSVKACYAISTYPY